MLKQIDKLLIRSFVGPFIVAFTIALFVFVMQTLWLYIDDIIGKGAGLLLVSEFIGYLSFSLMPLALPFAVLMASVMTMGNLAEHYELASMKSAGVPLLRIMRPLMGLCLVVAVASFIIGNNIAPVAYLKAATRLYDLRKQKPTLSLEEGVFNDDFQGFSIRIGSKAHDNSGAIQDVLLYKQGGGLRGRIEAVSASSGRMEVTPDDRYFILELTDGYQYQQPAPVVSGTSSNYPFVRTRFASYRRIFDLSEFEIDRTDETAFQDHQKMLSVRQLALAEDSIRRNIIQRHERLSIEVGRFFSPLKKLDQHARDSLEQIRQDSIQLVLDEALASGDSAAIAELKQQTTLDRIVDEDAQKEVERRRAERLTGSKADSALSATELNYKKYIMSRPNFKRGTYVDRALQFARSVKSYAESAGRRVSSQQDALTNHIYERHAKFNLAVACIIFLFIGAPMGAIIQKGGFGYPILVSIILFAIFIVMTIVGKKFAVAHTVGPRLGAWLPSLVTLPIGLLLTFTAMNDIKFSFAEWFRRTALGKWIARRNEAQKLQDQVTRASERH